MQELIIFQSLPPKKTTLNMSIQDSDLDLVNPNQRLPQLKVILIVKKSSHPASITPDPSFLEVPHSQQVILTELTPSP